MSPLPFALQLYSVRDHLDQDPAGTLRQLKEMGYDHVELAGTAGLSAEAFKALLDEAGLQAVSAHIGVEQIFGDLDAAIADAHTFGVRYAVVPWLGGELCPDKGTWMAAIGRINDAGAQFRAQGVRLCYHNHDHEFERFGGQHIFDMIFEHSAPENLAIELDSCWAHVGGVEPTALMARYGTRIPLLHVKDYTRSDSGDVIFMELGRGCMDWDTVLPAADACDVAWYIVEQDESQGDPLESARANAAFMKQR